MIQTEFFKKGLIIYQKIIRLIKKINYMNIQLITLEHTNPSLGPHETKTEIRLSISEEHQKKVDEFVKKAMINDTVTLYEYMKAVMNNDSKMIEQVLENEPTEELRQGETISHLSFYFENNFSMTLNDVYRSYKLSNFKPKFSSYMVKKGIISHHKANSFEEKILREDILSIKPPRKNEF